MGGDLRLMSLYAAFFEAALREPSFRDEVVPLLAEVAASASWT